MANPLGIASAESLFPPVNAAACGIITGKRFFSACFFSAYSGSFTSSEAICLQMFFTFGLSISSFHFSLVQGFGVPLLTLS